MPKFFSSPPRYPIGLFMIATVLVLIGSSQLTSNAGEPAADFLKRLSGRWLLRYRDRLSGTFGSVSGR